MKKLFFAAVALLIGAQFIPMNLTNPSYDAAVSMQVPKEVRPILQKACYDCHSNHTKFPWYAKVAPVSWVLASHVNEGRKALNFSTWKKMDSSLQQERIDRMYHVVKIGFMPKQSYTWMHPESKLDKAEKQVLKRWVESLGQKAKK